MPQQPHITRRAWLGAAATGFSAAAAGLATAPLAPARAATGAPAGPIRLNMNENAFGPSPSVGPAISAHIDGIARYVDQGEVDALVRQIAAHEGVHPAQVVLGEVLEPLGAYLAQQAGGGEVVFSTPGYTALVDAGAAFGARGVAVPLNSRQENDLPALARAITSRTIAVNLVNPHNPSGTLSDRTELDGFLRAAAQRTLVVVDEAYLEYADLAGHTVVPHIRQGANVLLFRTLAKIYGLAGLSIGYALAPVALGEGLRRAGVAAPHGLNRLSLVAASAALADQGHVARVREQTIAERQKFTSALSALGLQQSDSRANFVFFRVAQAAQVRERLHAAGIEVARAFPPLDDWIRITIGLPVENKAAIHALRLILK